MKSVIEFKLVEICPFTPYFLFHLLFNNFMMFIRCKAGNLALFINLIAILYTAVIFKLEKWYMIESSCVYCLWLTRI